MVKLTSLKTMQDSELLRLYAELMEELRNREIIRTGNNPVADYAEKLAVKHLRLRRIGKEEKGYDALDSEGTRYQIKGRRITRHNKSRQLSVIRNLDEKLFDYMIAVIFDEVFNAKEIWKIPYEFVKEHSKWSKQQNGYILHARPDVLTSDKRVKRVL